ncbi:MAG: sigma 54-interacting transcriptional regulator [Terriglobales bacterium]
MGSIATANAPLKLPPDEVIFGTSELMRVVRSKIERVANANIPVLIQGESGAGKELMAQLIHCRSSWSGGPFMKVNCPANRGILESELFGSEHDASMPGRVHLAQRGTLFLDEVAELDSETQAHLLQLLQDGLFCRIGADKTQEVRLVCSTRRRLDDEVEAGTFREDLFYRINVVTINLPPLRERRDDIPLLAAYFINRYTERYNCQANPLSPNLLRAVREYNWPGNIREFENLMKRYVILGTEEAIAGELQNRETRSFSPEIPLDGAVSLKKLTRQAVRELERQVILRSLQANNWNRKRVARALNISYRALLYKIRDAGLQSHRVQRAAAAAGEDAVDAKAA